MFTKALDAATAYGQSVARSAVGGGFGESSTTEASGSGGFGDFLSQALKDVDQTARKAESQSALAVAGKADLVDVVTAVNSAELALDTLVSVRDKVISAYQDIMRMPI